MPAVILAALLVAAPADAATPRQATGASSYTSLPADVRVTRDRQVVLQRTFNLQRGQQVLITAEGRLFPSGGRTTAGLRLLVDNVARGSESFIDWTTASTTDPAQHAFSCLASLYLDAGRHTVKLISRRGARDFSVGGRSNLSILVSPARRVFRNGGGQFTGIDVATDNLTDLRDLPTRTIASVRASAGGNEIIVLAAGRSRNQNYAGPYGDAKWGIGLNGNLQGRDTTQMSVQDLFIGAEQEAPMMAQARFPASMIAGNPQVQLLATEFPWAVQPQPPQDLVYRSRWPQLVALTGPFGVSGHVSTTRDGRRWDHTDYLNIGGNVAGSPPLNRWFRVARGTIRVPEGHNGIVYISGRVRFQGDRADAGGNGFLSLRLDGGWVGSVGVQQLRDGRAISQRTCCTSYLAAGNQKLAPGDHTIELMAKAAGDFKHLSVHRECNLLWFD